jgi:hypothetical protein
MTTTIAITLKTTFRDSFGLGAGYNFTKNLGLGVDVLYISGSPRITGY